MTATGDHCSDCHCGVRTINSKQSCRHHRGKRRAQWGPKDTATAIQDLPGALTRQKRSHLPQGKRHSAGYTKTKHPEMFLRHNPHNARILCYKIKSMRSSSILKMDLMLLCKMTLQADKGLTSHCITWPLNTDISKPARDKNTRLHPTEGREQCCWQCTYPHPFQF